MPKLEQSHQGYTWMYDKQTFFLLADERDAGSLSESDDASNSGEATTKVLVLSTTGRSSCFDFDWCLPCRSDLELRWPDLAWRWWSSCSLSLDDMGLWTGLREDADGFRKVSVGGDRTPDESTTCSSLEAFQSLAGGLLYHCCHGANPRPWKNPRTRGKRPRYGNRGRQLTITPPSRKPRNDGCLWFQWLLDDDMPLESGGKSVPTLSGSSSEISPSSLSTGLFVTYVTVSETSWFASSSTVLVVVVTSVVESTSGGSAYTSDCGGILSVSATGNARAVFSVHSRWLTAVVLDSAGEMLRGTSSGGGGHGGSGGSQPRLIFSRSRSMADKGGSLDIVLCTTTGFSSATERNLAESECIRFVNNDKDGTAKLGGWLSCKVLAVLELRAVERNDCGKVFRLGALWNCLLLKAEEKDTASLARLCGGCLITSVWDKVRSELNGSGWKTLLKLTAFTDCDIDSRLQMLLAYSTFLWSLPADADSILW